MCKNYEGYYENNIYDVHDKMRMMRLYSVRYTC